MPRRWIRSAGMPGDFLPQLERLVVVEIDGGPEPFGIEAVAALVDGLVSSVQANSMAPFLK